MPAEQYAIRTGQHPEVTTRENIAKFKKQLKRIGFSYDWEREISTADPKFYRWTQWIFLQIYNSWFNPTTKKAEPISTYQGDEPDASGSPTSRKFRSIGVPIWAPSWRTKK